MESLAVLKPDNHMYMCKSSMCEITYDLQYNITAIKSKKPFFVEVIPETVGQYTGLNDKNGNKIFEGDILQCNSNPKDIIKIVFGKFSVIDMETETAVDEVIGWHYEVIPTDAISQVPPFCLPLPLTDYYINRCNAEVIGNVHDNPELLDGGKQFKIVRE